MNRVLIFCNACRAVFVHQDVTPDIDCKQYSVSLCFLDEQAVTGVRWPMTYWPEDVTARARVKWTINLHLSKPNYRRGEGLSGGKCGTRVHD